ncbi:MAG: efflux RND transporter periplasmic adaptor subunit [Planctomycetota bacterium]|nr:efflux RND transporter periplasmic adaptor subunit [Planctomycetota bacterium]
MSPPEGLAALRVDRTQRRAAWPAWLWLVIIAVPAAIFAAPHLLRHFRAVEVVVAPAVRITASGQTVSAEQGSPELTAAGYVVADRQSVLAAKYNGRLSKMNVAEAQHVKKDEIVAEIDHRELDAQIASAQADQAEAAAEAGRLRTAVAQADASVAAAKAPLQTLDAELEQLRILLADAKRRLERDRKLAEGNAIGFSEVDDRLTEVRVGEAKIVWTQQRRREAEQQVAVAEAQTAMARAAVAVAEAHERAAASRVKVLESQLEECFIRAPFDGVVTEKAAEVGEIVAPISIGGSMARGSIATLADWSSLQAEVDVAETQLERVKPGQRAAITVDAFPGKVFPGKVRRMLPRANRSKATVQVRVDFIKRDDTVLPEMGVRVKFLPDDAPPGAETGAVQDRILAPKAAVRGAAGAAFVWVVADGVAAKRSVVAGSADGDNVEIKSGLGVGEKVVIRGAETFSEDKQKVRVAP